MPTARVAPADPTSGAPAVDLEYEVQGQGQPLLLIMGLGAQLVHWPQPLVDMLIAEGYQVIRFDNRDVGLSTKFDHAHPPRKRQLLLHMVSPRFRLDAAYRVADMARDAAGLLEHLAIPHAHVIGVSMGGMIAQRLTIDHPSRVRSLISIMSTPGGRRHRPKLKAVRAILAPRPSSREQAQQNAVNFFRTVGSPGLGHDDDLVREVAGLSYDRCFHPRGVARQLAAVLTSKNRYRELQTIAAPASVIHGELDPLVVPSAGRSTAAAIPEARLRMVPGMGHSLPRGVWPIVLEEQRRVAERYSANGERSAS